MTNKQRKLGRIIDPREVDEFYAVYEELLRASEKFGPFPTAHHGYAVIKEEVDELWDDVKANNIEAAKIEAIQVAAMAIRFCMDL